MSLWIPSPAVRIHVARQPTDMRKSFDGLCGLVRDIIKEEPWSGHFFVFFGKSRDKVKILFADRNGLTIWYKRLEKGTFKIPAGSEPTFILDSARLTLILEGLDLQDTKARKRYVHPTPGP